VALKLISEIPLPPHIGKGGFDHAAYHARSAHLYVAHTANDSLEIIDCAEDRHVGSLEGLKGIAGALASEERNLIFTSNRGEDTVGIFSPDQMTEPQIVPVGVRPNGLAFDPERGVLLVANVGDLANPASFTVSVVDIKTGSRRLDIPVPGRTRWAIFDPLLSMFFINIADPACIICISSDKPDQIVKKIDIPAQGPHGLDIDLGTRTLFCACDSGDLFALDADEGKIISRTPLAGTPDVIFFNRVFGRLYVTTGNPGLIEVFDTSTLKLKESIQTELGAHTIGYDWQRHKIYGLLPQTCRALVYEDSKD
jgi:hypothetical protein